MKKLSGLTTFIHSIRFRLVLWFTIILALVLFAFSVFIYYNQARDIRGEALFRLERKMAVIEATLSGSLDDPVLLQESDVFVLLGADGKVLTSQGISAQQDVLTLIKNAQNAQQKNTDYHADSVVSWIDNGVSSTSHYFFVIKPVSIAGQPGFAILGSPFDQYD